MKRNILVILGHPNKKSFNAALAESYITGVKNSNSHVKYIKLIDLKFDPIYNPGIRQKLEPDLKKSQELITWADHLVFIFPTWWGSYPALLKGFIDRTFTPGFAYKYTKKALLPQERYFKGKSARLIITFDGPKLFYKIFQIPASISIKLYTLFFCGITKSKTSMIGSIKFSDDKKRKKWLNRIKRLGEKNK